MQVRPDEAPISAPVAAGAADVKHCQLICHVFCFTSRSTPIHIRC